MIPSSLRAGRRLKLQEVLQPPSFAKPLPSFKSRYPHLSSIQEFAEEELRAERRGAGKMGGQCLLWVLFFCVCFRLEVEHAGSFYILTEYFTGTMYLF